jgi:hypothetical protein
MQQEQLTVWEQRWSALKSSMAALVPVSPDQDFPRRAEFQCLLNGLQAFAEGQFSFFRDGFVVQHSYVLQPSTKYPEHYVFSTILDQVASDLEVIQRAAQQRQVPALQPKLAEADKLAYFALKPALGTLIDENVTVVTYFQKSSSIRVIPYAAVALIGIPFTCQSFKWDYLAIPHEVGHYVFWKGKPDKRTVSHLHDALLGKKAIRAFYGKWVEEIFADVYGSLVAGAAIALSFQDLELESSGEDFIRHDGKHPAPVLRPFIYNKVLAAKGGVSKSWAILLANYWAARRSERDNKNVFTDSGAKHPMAEALQLGIDIPRPGRDQMPVDEIISVILTHLQGVKDYGETNRDPDTHEYWPGEQPDWPEFAFELSTQDQDRLATKLRGYCESGIAELLGKVGKLEAPPSLDEPQLDEQEMVGDTRYGKTTKWWRGWVKSEGIFGELLPPLKSQASDGIEPGEEDLDTPASNTWVSVLSAGDWATKGPDGRWGGK